MTVMLASLLLALTAFPQANVQQRTSGWCSPSTANIQGNVTVTCTGVDPKALERLNELLDQKDHEIQEKVRQANEWAERYFELEKCFPRRRTMGSFRKKPPDTSMQANWTKPRQF